MAKTAGWYQKETEIWMATKFDGVNFKTFQIYYLLPG